MNANKLTMYHVSLDHTNTIKEFIPRVPRNRASGEDGIVNRVCVSSSLEGCMDAHSEIWWDMVGCFDFEYFDPYEHMSKQSVLLDHNEDTGHLLKVYEFHVNEDELVKPEVLKARYQVPDALETQEHWITETISPNNIFYILVREIERIDGKDIYHYVRYEVNEIGEITDGMYHYHKQRQSA